MKTTHVVETGFNIGSIKNMLFQIDSEVEIVNQPININNIDRLIIPGIGKFDHVMSELHNKNLVNFLEDFRKTGKPILGICLGMQIMTESSDEGSLDGLGWFDGQTIGLVSTEKDLKIPHMGWNKVLFDNDIKIFNDIEIDHRFYFVHSYHVTLKSKENIIGFTKYGTDFISSMQKDNVIGVQFHPEKSQKHGTKIFENFLKL